MSKKSCPIPKLMFLQFSTVLDYRFIHVFVCKNKKNLLFWEFRNPKENNGIILADNYICVSFFHQAWNILYTLPKSLQSLTNVISWLLICWRLQSRWWDVQDLWSRSVPSNFYIEQHPAYSFTLASWYFFSFSLMQPISSYHRLFSACFFTCFLQMADYTWIVL